jgi:predicted Rossmann fold flavoprotein
MKEVWDVVVIGGGPAGMMAAGRAAEKGLKVLLLEKNPTLGKKLLITGGGRCNVANAEFDTRALLGKYGDAGKYLASPFASWSAKESIDFFESRGMPIKVEAEKRAFPTSNTAQSVLDVLIQYLKTSAVTIKTNVSVAKMIADDKKIVAVMLQQDGTRIDGKNFVLATGGKSRPETGSTGDGFTWARELGHIVSTSNAALVPVVVAQTEVRNVAGISLPKVKVTISQDWQRQNSLIGKLLFTHHGLSGPAILNLSREIGELLEYGEVRIDIDLMPETPLDALNTQLQQLIQEQHTKKIKNSLGAVTPFSLGLLLLSRASIDPEKSCATITREERIALMHAIKRLSFTATGLMGLQKAVVTSGGVSLDEIDTKTFRSRRYSNLYIIGDCLDISRPSGGYSLQLCWTSAQVAGDAVAHSITI